MNITLKQLKAMIPNAKLDETWLALANEFLPKYNIDTKERIAGFFAQAGHESGDLNQLSENLNYSAKGLRVTFARYFPTDALAKQYERQPERIANRVYDDALRVNKLGNVKAGDGWRFRGRGIFQLTGRDNYSAFARSVGMTAEQAADYIQTPRGAFDSACWFWTTRNLNSFADRSDVAGMSKAVNGGTIGLADRQARYSRNLAALATSPGASREIGQGCRGADVEAVQKALGIGADGIFGSKSEAAVRSWQRSNGYASTGKLTIAQQAQLLA